MFKSSAFADMLLKHLEEIDDPGLLKEEVTSIYMNIGGIICDTIEMDEALEDQIIAALRRGIAEIIREFAPDKHAMLNQ